MMVASMILWREHPSILQRGQSWYVSTTTMTMKILCRSRIGSLHT